MTMSCAEGHALRAAVKGILEKPYMREWTAQGLGMARCYLDESKKYRINVWDSRLARPGVSRIHTHPWHFDSLILNGVIHNTRFQQTSGYPWGKKYNYMRIACGKDSGAVDGGVMQCELHKHPMEIYKIGDWYRQEADEIHLSNAMDGTVTLNVREEATEDHSAYVFWPMNEVWVTAKPFDLYGNSVETYCDKALAVWE